MPNAEEIAKAKASSGLNSRTGTEDGAPPFAYFQGTSDFTNQDSALWVVILGFDVTVFTTGGFVEIKNSGGKIIDSWEPFQATAAGFNNLRSTHFLIPPGGVFHSSSTINFHAIKGRFEDVLRFL